MVLESLIVILLACYFDFMSKNYIYITCVGIGLEVLAIVMTLIQVPESPIWQLKMGFFAQAQTTIRKMMSINRATDWEG